MKRYLIIYHREDNDGLFSAAICENYIRKTNADDVKIDKLPSDYVSLSDIKKSEVDKWDEKYNSVIMTDISFSDPKMMKYLYKTLENKLVWIDHHLPAIKASFANGYDNTAGERNHKRSAILLAFKFFYDTIDEYYNDGKAPELLRILSAWDSFTYEKEGYLLEYVRDVNKGVTETYSLVYGRIYVFVENLLNLWNEYINTGNTEYMKFSDDNIVYFFSEGHKYNQYDDSRMERIVKEWGDMSWTVDGRSACALFFQEASNSLMFKTVADKMQNGIVFKHKPDGKWVMSLYNTNTDDNFHCGDYLKANYGGGGHVGAAGCTLSQEQFIELLTSKKI